MFCLRLVVGRILSRDRLVVRTLHCGRSNPGSNLGPGKSFLKPILTLFFQGFGNMVNLEIF